MNRHLIVALFACVALSACADTFGDMFGGGDEVALGPTAQAEQESCPAFESLKTGGGDYLDFNEYQGAGTVLFREWDDDNNEILTMEEFDDCIGPQRAAELLPRWDDNRDGVLSEEEFAQRGHFADLDLNQDSRLGSDEWFY